MIQSRRGSGTLIDVKLGWKEDWRTVYFALLWSAIGIIVRPALLSHVPEIID